MTNFFRRSTTVVFYRITGLRRIESILLKTGESRPRFNCNIGKVHHYSIYSEYSFLIFESIRVN